MIDREHALKPIALALGLAWGGAAAQGAPASTATLAAPTTQVVEVIGTAPLPGQGVDRDLLPYNTQLLRRSDIDRSQTEHTTDLLARRAAGVQVNEVQGSPYQGDLTFRGFRASGLLGAAQGLSVYLDGVRINEPFGDVVNWDLLPEFALDSVALVPGANPAFGLNTLGGAIAMTTVDGRSAPGLRAEARLGSFARRQVSLSHGGSQGGWSHYVGVGGFAEDGWRDHSDGHLGTLLAKLGHRSDAGDFRLSFLAASSRLVGNGLVPLFTFDEPDDRSPDLGADDRAAVYTHPDLTRQRLNQVSLRWTRSLDNGQVLEALAYVRHSRRTTVNGDEADDAEPGEDANASFNRTATRQRGQGVALGWSGRSGAHQWLAGLSWDQASVRYEQTEQAGEFDDTRGVDPIDGEEPELSAAVRGSSRSFGVHASDTWRVAAGTHLTGALRFNAARVGNTLTSVDDDTGEVEERPHERFSYRSWNPALGVAHRLGGTGTTVFANLARNTRVPTVIELGCADPEEPCRLPAGLQADPYLAPVRTTSLEAGLRYGRTQGHSGSLTLYRADNRDDILFSSVSVTGQQGYFRNFERTRHQGLDAEWHWRDGGWDIGLAYSHLQATYQADGVLRIGERNVQVRPGTRIAGLPRHTLKASVERSLGATLDVGADVQAVSRRVSAGNEDGRFDDDEAETADFSVPGYAITNLHATWRAAAGVEVYARVHNLFDRRSASFGALAETLFDRSGAYTGEEADALFVAPGAPRSFSLGVRVKF